MAGQSRGKGKALNTIAARSGRDPAAIVDSIQAAEKAQAKAEAAKQRAKKQIEADNEASKKAAAATKAASKKDDDAATKDTNHEEQVNNNNNNNNNPSLIYSSLSPQEQYRFQCYRRSGFASKPIEKFVAKMLVDEANRRFVGRRGMVLGLLGGRGVSGSGYDNREEENQYNDGAATSAIVTDGSDLDQHRNAHNKKRKKQSKKQMLQEESKRRHVAMDQPPPYLLDSFGSNNGGSGSSGSASGTSQGVIPPPLDQLVVPNSASEIVAVVSTLAKSYAQRLVSAARRVADAEEQQEEEEQKSLHESTAQASTKTTTTSAAATTVQKPISPHHLLEAHRYRSRAGLDPGFWMADRVVAVDGRSSKKASSSSIHTSVGVSEAAALGTEDRTRSCFLAAIAAQDAYYEARTKEVEEEDDGKHNKDEVKMDVDK